MVKLLNKSVYIYTTEKGEKRWFRFTAMHRLNKTNQYEGYFSDANYNHQNPKIFLAKDISEAVEKLRLFVKKKHPNG